MREIPAFFLRTDLPGVDYRKSPEQRWWEYSLEDIRHPQDPLTRGPGGERASPSPWSRRRTPTYRREIENVQSELDKLIVMVRALQSAGH